MNYEKKIDIILLQKMNITKQNIKNYIYFIYPPLLFLNIIVRIATTRTWSPDTEDYISIAQHLPDSIPFSLFPIFYPIALKLVNFFIHDYHVTYKVIAILSLFFCLAFVKLKNFFWKELWTMLCFYSFLRMAPWGLSEVIMIPLLILIFYYNYGFLIKKISPEKFIISNSIILIICILTKYSSIFYLPAFLVFSIILYMRKKHEHKAYIFSLALTSIATMLYLGLNYVFTGSAMGERVSPDGNYYNARLSFSQALFNLNPFFHGRSDNYLGFSLPWSIAYFFGILFSGLWASIILVNIKKLSENYRLLTYFLVILSLFFISGTIYSYFTTKIDILDFRLLLGFYTFIFFAVAVSLQKFNNKDFILPIIGGFCLITNIINLFLS